MSGSLQEFENSPYFWRFFVIAFPLLFLAIWSFVLWITARMSGWNVLARLYPYSGEEALKWQHRGGGGVYRAHLPFAGMRGRLAVGATKTGIIIKPPFILRPFHPAFFLPFDKIVAEEPLTILSFDFVLLTMQDAPDLRIGILTSAREMAEAARQ
ncbi:hypothetical protein [uncultured Litoreibacter sp.]|uniref:hypothetical protein n=1 Tax=uncultured Litoreibacter sp. TaxID=1392394 RepID=UPI0026373B57|nr:hypothetical protein [uncultured Litoreibacter sp.]